MEGIVCAGDSWSRGYFFGIAPILRVCYAICLSKQALLKWGGRGRQTNQHILKIESDLLLMFGQELVLLQMVCLVKHCACHLKGCAVSCPTADVPHGNGQEMDSSVRSGPFIQSDTVTERSQNQQQVFHLRQDRCQAGLDHRSPAWRQSIGAVIALQQHLQLWTPATE